MRAETRQLPGTWLVIGLLAAAIGWAAWLRTGRVIVPTAGGGPSPQPFTWRQYASESGADPKGPPS